MNIQDLACVISWFLLSIFCFVNIFLGRLLFKDWCNPLSFFALVGLLVLGIVACIAGPITILRLVYS